MINPPLPPDLNLMLNAKTAVTIGPLTDVDGDVASSGAHGSVLFDVSSFNRFGLHNVLANTVTVAFDAQVGHVFGNNVTINGNARQVSLGLDPSQLPQVPAVTPSTPGTMNVSTKPNQFKQLCPGQYGAMSLGTNSTLNLNGGVYQVTRLNLADFARLEPSEPVVILVSGGVTLGLGASIQPSAQAINPMTAGNIRIEVGGAVTFGNQTQVRAHLLVPAGKFTTGTNTTLTGAAWAKTIDIGPQSLLTIEDVFAAQTPMVPPPCNDNNACTTDVCVSTGTVVCTHTNTPLGSSCEDGNVCNGAETCDGAGGCRPGTNLGAGTSCADDTVCNGDETCDGLGSCMAGTPPEVDDNNPCTADACDPVTGVSHTALPDGTHCFGAGVCQAGVCSVAGPTFSADFIGGQPPTSAQCARWNDFRSQLVEPSYSSITIRSNLDPGLTCSDPMAATNICHALQQGNSFTFFFCDGHFWTVNQCGGSDTRLDVDNFCGCNVAYTARPCTSGADWGGVNTNTCQPPSQNITVVCE